MKKNKLNIILYLIFTFLSSFSFISPYLVMYITENAQISISRVGLLLLIYQVTKLIFEVPTGIIADRYSKKLSLIIGGILLIIACFLLYTNNIILLGLSFFIKAIGYTCISGSFEAVFINSLEQNTLAKMNSIERVFFYMGFAVSTAIGGIFIQNINYYFVITIDIIILVLSLITSILIYEKPLDNKEYHHEAILNSKLINIIKDIINNPIVFWLLMMDFATAISFISLEDTYSKFLSQFGIGTLLIGLIISFQFLVTVFVGYIFNSKVKNINKKATFRWLSMLFVVFAIFIYLDFIPLFFIPLFYILSDMCYSIFAPIKYELFQSQISDNRRTTILSIKSLVISLGGVLAYALISILPDSLRLNDIMIILLIITLTLFILINYKVKDKI